MAADALSAPSPPPRLRPFVALRNFVLFLLGFGMAASLLAKTVPFPNMGNLTRKDHHIRAHGDDYSLIYFGSSRVYHEFIPARFDEALAKHRIKSFNFGQDGMWPPESFYLVRKVIEQKPANLRWVLIDLMDIKATYGPGEGDDTTLRALYWHDWQHTCMAWDHLLEVSRTGQRTWQEKLGICWRHAELFGEKGTALGKGHERLEVLLKLNSRKTPGPVDNAGFEAGGNGPLQGADLEKFSSDLARLRANPPRKPINRALRKALDGLIADLLNANIQPVFVIASNLYGGERFNDWAPAGVPILAFDDPFKYPKLYDPAHRYDPHHLDPVGAEEFTRLLAERFAEILEAPR